MQAKQYPKTVANSIPFLLNSPKNQIDIAANI
jgi:hypothetical protein